MEKMGVGFSMGHELQHLELQYVGACAVKSTSAVFV